MGNKIPSSKYKVKAYDDDGGFIEYKLETKQNFQYADIKSIKESKIFRKECVKRVNSLPATNNRKKSEAKTEKTNATVHGFDQVRSHFGQKDCDDAQLNELEASIQLLNDKLSDLEYCRRECLDKLSELKFKIEDDILESREMEKCALIRLRLQVVTNFMQRIENLLQVNQEPFMVDAKPKKKSLKRQTKANFDKSVLDSILSSPNLRTKRIENNSPESALIKRQLIKDTYGHLIKSIMPKLYGNNFSHKANSDYRQYQQEIQKLRETVKNIPTQEEQQLVDAKRTFLQETELYLNTLDAMVQCNESGCQYCADPS